MREVQLLRTNQTAIFFSLAATSVSTTAETASMPSSLFSDANTLLASASIFANDLSRSRCASSAASHTNTQRMGNFSGAEHKHYLRQITKSSCRLRLCFVQLIPFLSSVRCKRTKPFLPCTLPLRHVVSVSNARAVPALHSSRPAKKKMTSRDELLRVPAV